MSRKVMAALAAIAALSMVSVASSLAAASEAARAAAVTAATGRADTATAECPFGATAIEAGMDGRVVASCQGSPTERVSQKTPRAMSWN